MITPLVDASSSSRGGLKGRRSSRRNILDDPEAEESYSKSPTTESFLERRRSRSRERLQKDFGDSLGLDKLMSERLHMSDSRIGNRSPARSSPTKGKASSLIDKLLAEGRTERSDSIGSSSASRGSLASKLRSQATRSGSGGRRRSIVGKSNSSEDLPSRRMKRSGSLEYIQSSSLNSSFTDMRRSTSEEKLMNVPRGSGPRYGLQRASFSEMRNATFLPFDHAKRWQAPQRRMSLSESESDNSSTSSEEDP